MNLETPEDGQWKLIVDVKLFADCSADAQAVEVKGQQKVYPLKAIYKTSGTRFDDCWLLLETERGSLSPEPLLRRSAGNGIWFIGEEIIVPFHGELARRLDRKEKHPAMFEGQNIWIVKMLS